MIFFDKVHFLLLILCCFSVLFIFYTIYNEFFIKNSIPEVEDLDKNLKLSESIVFDKSNIIDINQFISFSVKVLLHNCRFDEGYNMNKLLVAILKKYRTKYLLRRTKHKFIKDLLSYSQDNEQEKLINETELRQLLISSFEESLLLGAKQVDIEEILIALIKERDKLKSYIKTQDIFLDTIRESISYEYQYLGKVLDSLLLNMNKPYYHNGGIGKYWIYGYTYFLDQFGTDITSSIANQNIEYGIVHHKEIEEITAITGRMSNRNVLLLGDVGVGKSSIIKGFAQNIAYGRVPEQLRGKRVVQLNVTKLIALGNEQGNLEDIIQKSMTELEKAGNTILFIDEIQEIIPARSEQSGVSLSGMILPYILESKFPVIGTINYADYKKYFYGSESMRQSFEIIDVPPLSPSETLGILENKIPEMEKHYRLFIHVSAILKAIELSSRYIVERKLPDSAVRTIESTCSWAQSRGLLSVDQDTVVDYLTLQTGIPISKVTTEEAGEISNLEEKMKQKVIGQDEAIHKIVETIKRARADIRDSLKPIGVFMFMGSTGVGKTHLAKVLYKEFFKSNKSMIKVDMSEYQNIDSIEKFLGSNVESTVLSQQTVTLLDKVKANPYTVVLFDEIEKAHPQILDLFLQLFDEGRLTSSRGETVDFTNTIIINTSNIGSREIIQSSEDPNISWDETKKNAIEILKSQLRPELINRFDDIIVFNNLSKVDLTKIAGILLKELKDRLFLKGVDITWQDEIPSLIAKSAWVPGMGARPIKRYIQEKLEGRISSALLNNQREDIIIDSSWIV